MKNDILFVDLDDFKMYSAVVGQYDFEYIKPFVYQAQFLDMSQIMGESLSTRIQDGIRDNNLNSLEQALLDEHIIPTTVNFTMFRGMNFLNFKVENSGIGKRNGENQTSAELNETSFLADTLKTVAESYGKRLRDYLEANADSFPEFAQEMQGQISPSDTPSFTGGMWLGKKDCGSTSATSAAGSLSNLHMINYTSPRAVGSPIVDPTFDWTEMGTVGNKTMTDSEGGSFAVDAKPFLVGSSYNPTSPTKVTWVLNTPASGSTSFDMEWRYAAYSGSSSVQNISEAIILAGDTNLNATAPSYTVNMDVTASEFGYIAVHKASTGKIYTSWYETVLNNGGIGGFEFIKHQGVVSVNGADYDVYVWNYVSQFNGTIKFN